MDSASVPALALSPDEAWQPLPANDWTPDAARHLLRRAGWSAQPAEVDRAIRDGMQATLDRLFPAKPAEFPRPKLIESLFEDTADYVKRLREAAPEDRRNLQQEARARSQQAFQDLSLKWLAFACAPEHAAREKWVHFLGDVYVVGYDKVQRANLIYDHQQVLRAHSLGAAPALTKAVSRSPAMIRYLDLQQSQKKAPNENFARELFELFVLGEGNYSEKDIKEAARAFTGYREALGAFRFQPVAHDDGTKTVFGQTGKFSGDDIVDLAYQQPAAGTFLPREMGRFYLAEEPLPASHLAPLADWWRRQSFDLRALTHRFFGSRLFHLPGYRGTYIKSPVQFYLALVQDLRLDVAPLARQVLGSLRQMGQTVFSPPNIRGWVGGRTWINSATLSARRQLVQGVFSTINENNLNADDRVELVAARAEGRDRFTVSVEDYEPYASLTPEQITERFVTTFLPVKVDDRFRAALTEFLSGAASPNQKAERVKNAAVTLLQSPEYQLC